MAKVTFFGHRGFTLRIKLLEFEFGNHGSLGVNLVKCLKPAYREASFQNANNLRFNFLLNGGRGGGEKNESSIN